MKRRSLVVGVDVGGTFTDVFVLDEVSGEISITKVPSTLHNQAVGFVEGIAQCVDDFSAIKTVVHGTTVGTNALLERKGAKTGLITTRGFRDVLEMRRRDRPTTWGLKGAFSPVIERTVRLEVDERVLADGSVLQAVENAQIEDCVEQLLAAGCEAVCVAFINAYANADNEREAVTRVRQLWPNDYVTAASEILPEIREFERLSTGALNAYLQPRVSSYLDSLQIALKQRGCGGEVLIVQSNGGVMSVDQASAVPVRTALSGPAAGVIAAGAIARAAGFDNVITCDMGGTSFDVSLVANGAAALSAQTAVDFGLVIRTPMIEITTIGAGGGSIAWIDDSAILQVGPASAGSDPGPVCYGLGNNQPTVTDANLILGRINRQRPIGGKLAQLDVEAARAAIARMIAEPLSLSVEDAAQAIMTLANAHMAGAIRLVSIEQGHDPTEFVAMPFGGGGALHTGALIREVGLKGALVPRYPGVTSALGCVVADMRHDRVQTINRALADIDCAELARQMESMAADCETLLTASKVQFSAREQQFELDMLYVGQTHTVAVPLTLANGAALQTSDIQAAFDNAYRAAFGRLLDGIALRVMNLRISVIGRRPALDMSVFAPPPLLTAGHETNNQAITNQAGNNVAIPPSTRTIYADGEFYEAAVYERHKLAYGSMISGPALLEQSDATIYIDPGLCGQVDQYGNIFIRA